MAKGLILGEQMISLPNDQKNYSRYLTDVAKYQILSTDEEVEYFNKYRAGDQSYYEKIAQRNLRFVISVAKKYQTSVYLSALTFEDLISEGNIGLCLAIQKFDPTMGFKFISFAVWHIRAKIMESIQKHIMLIRQPSNRHSMMWKLQKLEMQLQHEYEMYDIPAELLEQSALENDIKLYDKMIHIKSDFSFGASLDSATQTSQKSGSDLYLKDILEDTNTEKTDNRLLTNEKKQYLDKILDSIPKRAADSIRMYYGLNGQSPLEYDEIGRVFEVTGERIRQIMQKWMRRLNRINEEEYNTEYN